jgi:hypothetical protein
VRDHEVREGKRVAVPGRELGFLEAAMRGSRAAGDSTATTVRAFDEANP